MTRNHWPGSDPEGGYSGEGTASANEKEASSFLQEEGGQCSRGVIRHWGAEE